MQGEIDSSFAEDPHEIELADVLLDLAAGEVHIAVQHRLHVVDVAIEAMQIGLVLGEGQLKLEAGEDGAEVMADAGEHRGALLDLPFDSFAHLDEGKAGAPDLVGAARTKLSGFCPLPKLSAARAKDRIGRIWPRRKRIEMPISTSEVPNIQIRKIWVLDA